MGEDELRSWLDTNESSSVGMTLPGEDESQGHKRCVEGVRVCRRERGRQGWWALFMGGGLLVVMTEEAG